MKELPCSSLTPHLSWERVRAEPSSPSIRREVRRPGSPPSRPGRQHPCPLARDLPRARSTATCSLWSRETSGARRRRRRWRERRGERSSGRRRLRSLCSHHVIYSPRATGSTRLGFDHPFPICTQVCTFFRILGRERWTIRKSPGVNAFRAGRERIAGRDGQCGGWGGGAAGLSGPWKGEKAFGLRTRYSCLL